MLRGKEGNRNSRTGGLVTVGKQTWEEAIKSKANSQTHRSKLSLLHQVNEQKSLVGATKAREKVGVANKLKGPGKENNAGEIHPSQKCSGKARLLKAWLRVEREQIRVHPRRVAKLRQLFSKGRNDNRREGKSSTNSIMKVHFR